MSHTTTIRAVSIRDISALQSAVSELQAEGIQCELVQNQKPRLYYKDQHSVCPYVLKLKNSRYDVGFDLQKDGSLVPITDEFGGDVAKQIGAKRGLKNGDDRSLHAIGNLMQKYAKNAAINQAMSQGYFVESCEVDNEMNVHLTLGGM